MLMLLLWACGSSEPNSTEKTVETIETVKSLSDSEDSAPKGSTTSDITLSGTVTYSGTAHGSIEVEVLDNSTGEPRLLGNQSLDSIGDFSVTLSEQSTGLTVMAYVDLTGDRISDDDPRGYLLLDAPVQSADNLTVEILEPEALKQSKQEKGSKKNANVDTPKTP